MKSLSDALAKNRIMRLRGWEPISIVNVAGYFNLGKPFTISALINILLKNVICVPENGKRATKLYKLTGEWDREQSPQYPNGKPTISRTETQCGLIGTDLGSSFEHIGRVYFLFGDTNPDPSRSIAFTEDEDPEQGLHLNFVLVRQDFPAYWSPYIQSQHDISLDGGFNVMTAGFSANGKMYVYFTTNHFKYYGFPDAPQGWDVP